MSVIFDIIPVFQSIFVVFPELFCVISLIVLLIYGLLIPVVSNSGVIGANYSVCFSWLVLFSIIIFLGLSISNLGFGNDMYLFGNEYFTNDTLTVWKVLLGLCFVCVLVLSLEYQKYENLAIFEYPVLFLIAFIAMIFLLCANSFISFYLALEAQSLTLYILAGFARKNELSTESAIKYFILGVLASGILLLGITFVYMGCGTLNFVDLQVLFATPVFNNSLSELGISFITIALMFKLAAAPFHVWSPDVYEGAPMPSTIFFATVVKLTSIIISSRILFEVFADLEVWYPVVSVCAFLSFVFGAFGTLQQTKVKRFIAYSGITNIGFFLLCFLCVPEVGFTSLLLYSIVYMLTTFGFLGVTISMLEFRGVTGSFKRLVYLADFGLLLKKNIQLGLAAILFLFSMAGIPPVAGFFAKFYVLFGLLNSNGFFLAMFALLVSVLTSYYYIRIIKIIGFSINSSVNWKSFKTPSREVSLLIGVCLLLICFYAIYPAVFLSLIDYATI